jgi:hypothetical protein
MSPTRRWLPSIRTRARNPWVGYLLDPKCVLAVVVAPILVMRWTMSTSPPKEVAAMLNQFGVLRLGNVTSVQVLAGIVLTSGMFALPAHWRRWRDEGRSTRAKVLGTHAIGMAIGFAGVAIASSSELKLNAPDRLWLLMLGAGLGIITVLSVTVAWVELSKGNRVLRWLGLPIAIVVTACASFPPSPVGMAEGGPAGFGGMRASMPGQLPLFFRVVSRVDSIEPLSSRLPMRSYQSVIGSAWVGKATPGTSIVVCLVIAGLALGLACLVLRRSSNVRGTTNLATI